ncbi:MAG: hypothetical protein HQL34_05905 [Alphaproteobacteria bacterium]|nr:hypothetical protein [Alphaproteobacteria bacterium]
MSTRLSDSPDAIGITYTFRFAGDQSAHVPLSFDRATFELRPSGTGGTLAWTALEFCRCAHCPLTAARSPRCPFARAIAEIIPHFETFYSYEETIVEVATAQRTIVARCPLQNGMAALIGLIGATCGCPLLAFLRPMARFHLPFASEEETMYRAVATDLLRQYLSSGPDRDGPATLDGLRRRYEAAAEVNMGMAARIRTGSGKDAAINGLIILDTFAQAAPYVIDGKLEELRYVFDGADRHE